MDAQHLAQLLADFRPTDDEEARYHAQMLALLDAPEPFSRRHFRPGHFTASAFVLSPDQDALLLVFHGKLHRWLQPGGHVDPHDGDIVAAARREVAEELGIHDLTQPHPGIFDLDVHEIPALHDDPPHAHFDVRFLFRAHNLQFTAGSDAKDARWWPLDEIDILQSDRSVMRAVEKLRAT